MTKIKKSIICALCLSLCAVLPGILRLCPPGTWVYDGAGIPVLICTLLCGGGYGLMCGALGGVFSFFILGMGAARLPGLIIKYCVYALAGGIMMKILKDKKRERKIYISCAVAVFTGNVFACAANALIFARGIRAMGVWAAGEFIGALPGIIVSLVLVPNLALALIKGGAAEDE